MVCFVVANPLDLRIFEVFVSGPFSSWTHVSLKKHVVFLHGYKHGPSCSKKSAVFPRHLGSPDRTMVSMACTTKAPGAAFLQVKTNSSQANFSNSAAGHDKNWKGWRLLNFTRKMPIVMVGWDKLWGELTWKFFLEKYIASFESYTRNKLTVDTTPPIWLMNQQNRKLTQLGIQTNKSRCLMQKMLSKSCIKGKRLSSKIFSQKLRLLRDCFKQKKWQQQMFFSTEKKVRIYFGILLGGLFCFSVWLVFVCVCYWFSILVLIFSLFSIGFPCFWIFHCFSCVFLTLPLFSIRVSLVALVFPLVLLCFPYVFIGFLVFSWFLCVFISVFLHVFLLLVFSTGFWFYCIFLTAILFLLWICFICFPLSLVVFHIPEFLFFPPSVFVHCPHSFLLQHMVAAGCCCWWWWWLLLLSWSFLWADSRCVCQWCCCLAVATWTSSGAPIIKKSGRGARAGGAGGGRSAFPRNAFQVARCCLCAFAFVVFVHWSNVTTKNVVVTNSRL